MLINIENKGITKEGYANMCVTIKGKDFMSHEVCFMAAINAMHDLDKSAFMNALEAFLKEELEQDDDEE